MAGRSAKRVGVAEVGAGKIGRHRARLSAAHAGAAHLAIDGAAATGRPVEIAHG